MKLSDLLKSIKIKAITGDIDTGINSIQFDSRKVSAGDLFVAVRGTASDGHDFISMAIEKGAAAVVVESGEWRVENAEVPSSVFPTLTVPMPIQQAFIQVENSAEALDELATA